MTTLIERARAYLIVAQPRGSEEDDDDERWTDADVERWLKDDSREARGVKACHVVDLPNSVLAGDIRNS